MSAVIATCLTLPAVLLANPGATITLARGSVCRDLRLVGPPSKVVTTIKAGGTVTHHLRISGTKVRWRGGTLRSNDGPYAVGPAGYAVLLNQAEDVRVDGALITDANRGVVVEGGARIALADSRFYANGSDGVIASGTKGLTITRNTFRDTRPRPGIDHPDAIQLRNGVADALIEHNVIEGDTQGIAQMDKATDEPIYRIRVRFNVVRTNRPHKLTAYRCVLCTFSSNTIGRASGSTRKPVIIAPGVALEANTVEP